MQKLVFSRRKQKFAILLHVVYLTTLISEGQRAKSGKLQSKAISEVAFPYAVLKDNHYKFPQKKSW